MLVLAGVVLVVGGLGCVLVLGRGRPPGLGVALLLMAMLTGGVVLIAAGVTS